MPFPTPTPMKSKSSAHDLKRRLDWGEPALTIVDVRNRDIFNAGHIMGAIPMPHAELVQRALSSLELNRDIYVYGDDDEATATAATLLRDAGYVSVSELAGGFEGWKANGFPTEASSTMMV